ncbi:Nucleotide-diphospho-sugar transferase [Trema orientale]|uniref:Nucleotide-diphospho-sugar transferase n=1 Tax=Trema orientale TaxID=63057 RepID=A0A2P5CQF2_TREOI|nr:Nucleotide-diphospho-sugar transferase [Trema orientale]
MTNKTISVGQVVAHNQDSSSNSSSNNGSSFQRILRRIALFAAVALGCLVLLSSINPNKFLSSSFFPSLIGPNTSQVTNDIDPLNGVLRNASMKGKTVILTTLNDAWAEPNSIFDLFIESFQIGNNTKGLLKHLVVICLDDKAYSRCLASHPHCYYLRTNGANFTKEASFMSSDYLEMMWRRIEFLGTILEMGYSFIFTDSDIMWLRDPFQRFFQDADFQIACDIFKGNSYDRHNDPNGGFTYVKSNDRTIKFYKFWYFSRRVYPGLHDQDVLNRIKFDPFIDRIGLQMRFLDTVYFGGFCQPSRDFNLVCTMHANCCVGLDNKLNDLAILLEDWRRYMSPQPSMNAQYSWSVPQNCSTSFQRMREQNSGSKS